MHTQLQAEEGKKSTATALRRWSIYGLLMGDILALKIPRLSIPSMVPFIVAELGLPQSSVPALLSAFHPGYVVSNLPGGPLVQRFGPATVPEYSDCFTKARTLRWTAPPRSLRHAGRED